MPFNPFHRRHTPVYDFPPGPPPQRHHVSPEVPFPVMTTDFPPPEYAHSDRVGHEYGALSDADPYECEAAQVFCSTRTEQTFVDGNAVYDREGELVFHEISRNPVLLPVHYEDVTTNDASMWRMNPPEGWYSYDTLRNFPQLRQTWWDDRFGTIKHGVKIKTTSKCPIFCFMSNLPLLAAHSATEDNLGVYYEIRHIKIGCNRNYSVAIGENFCNFVSYFTDRVYS